MITHFLSNHRLALLVLVPILVLMFASVANASPLEPADTGKEHVMPFDVVPVETGAFELLLSCADPADPTPCVLVDPAIISGIMDSVFAYVGIFLPMLVEILSPILSLKIAWGLSLAIVGMIFGAFMSLATLGGALKL